MRPIRLAAVAALLALLAVPASAQTVAARGTDATFDVASWNVEHFGDPGYPPSDATQLNNVEAVVSQAGIDLWAFQEIGDADAWQTLLERLQDDGYAGRLGPETPGTFQLRLGFIYNPSVVQIIGTRTILTGSNFGGRLPFEVQARVTIDGQARTVRIIDLHAKAGTGADDYSDRVAGAAELKAYIDDRLTRGDAVILLGDFNDYLTRSTRNGQPSPYAAFLADDDYIAATLGIEQSRVYTYCTSSSCSSGSTRDHLLIAGLDAEYVSDSGDRYSEVLTGVPSYTSSTSDHVPVLAQFSFRSTAAETDPEAGPVALLPPAPSPFRDGTRLRFRLDMPSDVRLEVFDVVGRRVASLAGAFGTGEHTVPLDGAGLAPGTYVVRLSAADVVRTGLIVRSR